MNTPKDYVDSWESRITEAAKIIGKTPTEVEAILNAKPYCITKDPNRLEMISDEEVVPFGDLRKMFCDDNEVTLPQLRLAMKWLRGPKNSTKATEVDTDIFSLHAKYGIENKIEDLDIELLLPFYKPNKKNHIHDILINRYENRFGPIIAFNPESNEIAIEAIINYVSDLESGLPQEESIEVNGELVRLYRVGQVPNEQLEEDPLVPETPLRRGRSTFNRINWNGIQLETRQFFRVLLINGDINASDRVGLRTILTKSIQDLKTIFPESYLDFKEKKLNGELPTLKVSTSAISKSKQNPFSIKTNRTY